MTATKTWVAVAAIVAVSMIAVGAVAPGAGTQINALAFHDGMRKLWEDHVTWTRLVIVGFVGGLPDTTAAVTRLLENQVDIGNAVKPFYGVAAGDQLTGLLQSHIRIAAEILGDAKAGDTAKLNDAVARWYRNADDIAAFLSAANPKFWPLPETRTMMHTHLDLTLQEAVAELKGDYAGSVAEYDSIHAQILDMADMLSSGIILQFPQMFQGVSLVHG